MRAILCPVDHSATADDRIETALALARVMDGHVTFQIGTPFAELAMWEPFGGAALAAEAIQNVRLGDEQLARDLDARLATQDVRFEVVMIDQGRVEGVASAARFTDIVISSLEDPALEEIGLGARAAVLALPKGVPMLVYDRPVVIAWDGGHESAAAMRAALPVLKLARAVHLLTVRAHHSDHPADQAAAYLSRHDIHAECHEIACTGSIARTIGGFANTINAGLIVMGLFGKSRLRELLMGGVSRAMLDGSAIPLLLAH